VRSEFDQRSSSKREASDKKREDLSAALAALAKEEKAEHELIDKEFESVVKTVDGVRSEIDACRKKAEGLYEAREASIRKTQVHRIATTVEIVRGLIKGERPMSIKTTAKERGDILTDQISMVRIWVYPVLAFIVAFLPTLMVEIGFSTVFQPERQRPAHRLGFFGRRMHWLYTRAGRLKISRAERIANEASAEIALRSKALAEARAAAEKALSEKDAELQTARETIKVSSAKHAEQLKRTAEELTEQAKKKEEEWVAKLAGLADSLNRTVVEKDALRDLQKSEIERQIQMRQNAWSDRLTQSRQELDEQRAASEAERTALLQEHHKKLMEVSEECKTQVSQARRQMADAELAAVEKTGRLERDLKEAMHARDDAEAQLKQQSDSLALRLSQAQEDAAREMEKTARLEKHRAERQQLEFEKTLRQREDDFEHRLKQREQEMTIAFEGCLAEEKTKAEQAARLREAELERQLETRARELQQRWNQEAQQQEDTAHFRLSQREQHLQAQAEEQLRRRESELKRQLDAQALEAELRLKQELQQKELAFQAKLKQREQELVLKADARETELQSQWASDQRVREEEWERQAQARVRALETRLGLEAQQKEEQAASKSRQRDQQWQAKLDAVRAEAQAQAEEILRRREAEADAGLRELESNLRKEMQQKEEAAQTRARQREQELVAQLNAQIEARQMAAQAKWEAESEERTRAAIEPYKVSLARLERERADAEHAATESARQVEQLEKKLTEASSFLNTWRNGKKPVGAS
jgi:hypothetical protein